MPTRNKVAEMVEEEAARAEAEHPDEPDEPIGEPIEGDEPDPDDEPDEHPAEPSEPVALSIEEVAKRIETEGVRHVGELRAIFGPDFDTFEECPMCHLLGVVAPESPVLDPTTQRCTRCRGHGELVTEAQNPTNITRQCPDCMGNGYVPRIEPVQAQEQYAPPPPNGGQQTYTVPPMPTYDAATGQWRDPSGRVLTPAS